MPISQSPTTIPYSQIAGFLTATGLVVALLAFGWKFGLEELLDPFLPGIHAEESAAERWEFVVVSSLFAVLATALPTLVAYRQLQGRLTANRLSTAVFASAPQPMVITDPAARVRAVNPAFETLSGWTTEQVVGQPLDVLCAADNAAGRCAEILRALDAQGEWRGELHNRRQDGTPYVVSLAITGVRDEQGTLQQYIAILTDITWQREREELALYDATHDALTGLANRRLFLDRLNQVIAASAIASDRFALLFIDLDGFKTINDTLGHAAGDVLLTEVALRLSTTNRGTDLAARLAGDEFVIIQREVRSRGDAQAMITRIQMRLATPVDLAGGQVHIRASIGIALYPEDGTTAQALLDYADNAMYTDKAQRRHRNGITTLPEGRGFTA